METIRDDIFTAIHSPNPLEETVERISGAIRARLLSPGDRLPAERELAASLGVSRSTLRVALQSLLDEGWLEVRRGRHGGSFVARWPDMPQANQLADVLMRYRSKLPELLDYRRAVESTAAACAAQRGTQEELDELLSLNQMFAECYQNFEVGRAIDARFHIGVARAAHSPRLMEAVTEVQSALTEVLDVMMYYIGDQIQDSIRDHQLILDAICRRDEAGAQRAMLNHVTAIEQLIYQMAPQLRDVVEESEVVEIRYAS